jgi:hypothetical protein
MLEHSLNNPRDNFEGRKSNNMNLDAINHAKQVQVEQKSPTWRVVKILAHAKLSAWNFPFY